MLSFESAAEKRRLVPLPKGWEGASDEQLVKWLAEAKPFPKRGSFIEWISTAEENGITDGKERIVIVDDEYIKRSLYEPNADVVKGYNQGLMISYKQTLSEDDVAKIVEYIKELKKDFSGLFKKEA